MQTNSFSINRLLLLLKYDLFGMGRRFWLVLGATLLMWGFSINTMTNSVKFASRDDWNNAAIKPYLYFEAIFFTFPASHLIVGMLFTSIIFFQLTTKGEKLIYLSLPATIFEKWLSKWVITGIIFPLGFLFFYLLGIQGILMYNGVSLFAVSDSGMLIGHQIMQALQWYWVLHALFFLGAMTFTKWSGVKTLLVLSGILVILTLVARTSLLLFYGEWIPFADFANLFVASSFSRINIEDVDLALINRIVYIFLSIAALIFLMISYLKLKEKEVA
ncbi:MAG: hypothetical protein AAFO07_18145 [Bacteroidota bacterium]